MHVWKADDIISDDFFGNIDVENINRFSARQVINNEGEAIVLFCDNDGEYCHINGEIDSFERQYEAEFNEHLTKTLNARIQMLADEIIITAIDVELHGMRLNIISSSVPDKIVDLEKEYTYYLEEDLISIIINTYDF
jgi:hypothetical protein